MGRGSFLRSGVPGMMIGAGRSGGGSGFGSSGTALAKHGTQGESNDLESNE
jgi:hypothetical protein